MSEHPYTVVSPVFVDGVEQFGVACNRPDERESGGTLHCTHGNIIAVCCSDLRAFEICDAMNERAKKFALDAERERQQTAVQTTTTK